MSEHEMLKIARIAVREQAAETQRMIERAIDERVPRMINEALVPVYERLDMHTEMIGKIMEDITEIKLNFGERITRLEERLFI